MSGAPSTITRGQLVTAILEVISGDDLLPLAEVQAQLEAEIDRAGPSALVELRERLTAEYGWNYYPSDPLARRIHHLLADRFLTRHSMVDGAAGLTLAARGASPAAFGRRGIPGGCVTPSSNTLSILGRRALPPGRLADLGATLDLHHGLPVLDAPLVILANHLSYADANVVEVLLRRCGAESLANRLTAIAGPKVFSSRQRRFSSLCFGAIKVPQSADVSSMEAKLSARDVARASRAALDAARTRLEAGDALLLFAEGTRSRAGQMGRMLPAAARYLEAPGTWLVPVGLTGPEALFPIDSATVRPAHVEMRLGAPLRAEALFSAAGGDRRLVMDAVGLAIADLLPGGYRGLYGNEEFGEVRQVLNA